MVHPSVCHARTMTSIHQKQAARIKERLDGVVFDSGEESSDRANRKRKGRDLQDLFGSDEEDSSDSHDDKRIRCDLFSSDSSVSLEQPEEEEQAGRSSMATRATSAMTTAANSKSRERLQVSHLVVWFKLVDVHGVPLKYTSADKVKLAVDCDVADFRKKVKALYADGLLKTYAPSGLLVFASPQSLKAQKPLDEACEMRSRGASKRNALLVAIPGHQNDPAVVNAADFDHEWVAGTLSSCPPTLPEVPSLADFVAQPLPVLIPLGTREHLTTKTIAEIPNRQVVQSIFEQDESKQCERLAGDVINRVLRPHTPSVVGASAADFQSFYDDLIRMPLKHLFRDASGFHHTRSSVDFRVIFDGDLVFHGQENLECRNLRVVEQALANTIDWNQRSELPYLLGYAATGYELSLCAIVRPRALSGGLNSRRQMPSLGVRCCPTIHRIARFTLNSLSARLQFFRSLVHMARLIPLILAEHNKQSTSLEVSKSTREPQPQPLAHVLSSSEVGSLEEQPLVKCEELVTKTYPNPLMINHLQSIYRDMQMGGVPNVDRLETCSNSTTGSTAVFRRRGYHSQPRGEQQLLMTLKNVTQALVALHRTGWIHRDLQWSHVMMRGDSLEWFVTGFEHAMRWPVRNTRSNVDKLCRRDHAPEMFEDTANMHSPAVDVWSIGHLIHCHRDFADLSDSLVAFSNKLLSRNPHHRPSMSEVCEEVQQRLRAFGC